MNDVMKAVAPSVTNLIRADHTKVLGVFHRYKIDTPPATKQALVDTICLSLEIHAQLEEEIFYPAVREVDAALVERSVPEHDEMRRLVSSLRNMPPTSEEYDGIVMKLMRNVIHHVADEETMLLPAAERLLRERIHDLGVAFLKRKVELSVPHAGQMAQNAARAVPTSGLLMGAGVLLLAGLLAKHASRR